MTDLDALDTLHKAATAGDWRTGIGGYGVVDAGTGVLAEFARKGDAAAIVALHNAWPAIRADIARLTKERDEARHQVDVLLARIYNDRGDYAYHNGIESAIDHAKLKIASVYGELEDANASVRRLTEERDEARAEVERLRELGPPHRMDAPDGPVCRCGRPSEHESGACAVCVMRSERDRALADLREAREKLERWKGDFAEAMRQRDAAQAESRRLRALTDEADDEKTDDLLGWAEELRAALKKAGVRIGGSELLRELAEEHAAAKIDALVVASICKCGHAYDAHSGHTVVRGRPSSTHCACCECREFRPEPTEGG